MLVAVEHHCLARLVSVRKYEHCRMRNVILKVLLHIGERMVARRYIYLYNSFVSKGEHATQQQARFHNMALEWVIDEQSEREDPI